MKATIYAALCYRTRVVTGPRQRRPCGMTEAFLPLPSISLRLSIEILKYNPREGNVALHVEVIASVMTYLPSHIASFDSFFLP